MNKKYRTVGFVSTVFYIKINNLLVDYGEYE